MLELYENIRKRRIEMKLTQAELAQKMGYADKSMIAKIEKGLVDLPQSKIIALAKALDTKPGILMGWTDAEKKENGVKALPASAGRAKQEKEFFEVTPKEKSIIERYRRLDAPGQDAVDWMLIHETARTEELRTFSRDIDAEVEDFRRELEMEKRTARSQAFAVGKEERA